jgi:hypothetical protein
MEDMNKIASIVLSIAVWTSQAFATAQEPEVLIYLGKTNDLYSTPLESYFTTNNPRPEVWKQAQKAIFDSGCWRRYVGTWVIRDETLFLDALRFPECPPVTIVEGGRTNTYVSPLPLLLPGKELPLKADWFTEVIRLPQGKELQYVHMGFGSIYESDHFIKIEMGKVVAAKTVNNLNNPKLYTSEADLQWQEIGKMTKGGGLTTDDPFAPQPEQKDQGDWYDARMVRTTNFIGIVKSGKPFSTRGIFVYRPDELFGADFALFVPPTPLTQADRLRLAEIPAKPQVANGSHVEIKAKFQKANKGYALHVLSIRELQNDESIHREDYKLPNKLLQDTANEPPEGDPFAAPEE